MYVSTLYTCMLVLNHFNILRMYCSAEHTKTSCGLKLSTIYNNYMYIYNYLYTYM